MRLREGQQQRHTSDRRRGRCDARQKRHKPHAKRTCVPAIRLFSRIFRREAVHLGDNPLCLPLHLRFIRCSRTRCIRFQEKIRLLKQRAPRPSNHIYSFLTSAQHSVPSLMTIALLQFRPCSGPLYTVYTNSRARMQERKIENIDTANATGSENRVRRTRVTE